MSVARQEKPGAITFTVPHVPDGEYLVVIFDLSEGGPRNHYTWNTFTVKRDAALPVTGSGAVTLVAASVIIISVGALFSRVSRPRQ